MCTKCAHFTPGQGETPPSCTAFPEGIPDEIIRQGFDHRNEFPGDGGVRFTPDGPVDVDFLDRNFT